MHEHRLEELMHTVRSLRWNPRQEDGEVDTQNGGPENPEAKEENPTPTNEIFLEMMQRPSHASIQEKDALPEAA